MLPCKVWYPNGIKTNTIYHKPWRLIRSFHYKIKLMNYQESLREILPAGSIVKGTPVDINCIISILRNFLGKKEKANKTDRVYKQLTLDGTLPNVAHYQKFQETKMEDNTTINNNQKTKMNLQFQ